MLKTILFALNATLPNGESYTLDYDLTASDCRAAMVQTAKRATVEINEPGFRLILRDVALTCDAQTAEPVKVRPYKDLRIKRKKIRPLYLNRGI